MHKIAETVLAVKGQSFYCLHLLTCGAGEGVKPGVKRSETPGSMLSPAPQADSIVFAHLVWQFGNGILLLNTE